MKIYNSERSIEIPKGLNLTQLLHQSHTPLPDSHLIASDSLTNRSITIGELRSRAGRLAKGIIDNINPEDQARWTIILPNCVEFLELAHSILWTGGVVCPINWALKAKEIGHGIAVSRPSFIVAYGKIANVVEQAIEVASEELKRLGIFWQRPQLITVIERARQNAGPHFPDTFIADEPLPIPHYTDTTNRLATIHLSSGTTGAPKGVLLTHRNYVANVYQLLAYDASQFHPASKTVAFTPWAHIAMTTMPLFLGPYAGMFHHAMPVYNLEKFGQIVGSLGATSFQGLPSVVLQLARGDVADKNDFSKAEVINVGGLRLNDEDEKKLLKKAPWRFCQAYGMTEAAGYVAYQHSSETLPLGSTGRLLPGIEARLVLEEKGVDAPNGGPGELWLRGPNITSGYAFNEEANRKGFPEPGWYNTGDVCTIDDQGLLYIVGRTKDLIKYKGFQVSPTELESYVNSHPDVLESGVGALWDEEQLTELPTAWVILKPEVARRRHSDRRETLKSVQGFVDEQVSGYKKLRGGIWEIEKLPKNATGKILRKEMTEMRSGLCSLDSNSFAKAKL